jgi:SdrD B-like domain/FG-GAP-like repeat
LSTAGSTAVSLTSNTGATINFNPVSGGNGLDIITTTGTGFNATGGGTVTVQGSGNTITSTSATALNVANTTIGAADLTFQSISAGNNTAAADPVSGIVLNNTGTLASNGGLVVTGDTGTSANGSGGTVQNSTGAGILLTNTRDVSLDQMNVTSSGDDGIHGVGVVNFTLNRSNIINNGNSTSDDGVQFGEASGSVVGVTGNVSILSSSINGNAHNGFWIRNTSGTIDNLTVTGSTFNDVNDTFGANAFLFEASGTSTVTEAFITGSTFANNTPQRALEVQSHDTATISDFVVSGNTFTNNGIHASFTQDSSSNIEFYFVNNGTAATPMTGSILQAINVFSSSQSTGGTIVGTIQGNQVGSTGGGAISAVIQGQTDATLLIDSNVISQTSGDSRAIGVAFRGPAPPLANTLGANTVVSDVTITNNNVTPGAAPSGFPLAAIMVEADNQTGADNKAPTVNADIRGNTVPNTAVFDLLPTQIGFFEYDAANGHGIGQLVDTAPASADATAQLTSTNTGSASAFGISLISGPINTPPPVPTPLLAADGAATTTSDVPPVQDDPLPPVADTTSGPGTQAVPVQSDQAPPVIVNDSLLTQAKLDGIVNAAIARWSATGLTAEQVSVLEHMTFTVGDLSGLNLGSFTPAQIMLDTDAAGHGWYLDGTPRDDAEFGNGAGTRLATDPTQAPAGHYDLLTTVMHEMGHALGLEDRYEGTARDALMYGWLFTGERRLPGAGEADDAVAGSITTEEFAGSPIAVGPFTLPAGKTVTIQWQATVDPQTNQLIDNPVNTGTVTATNAVGFPDANTNTVTTTLDTLVLGGTIWNDNGVGGGTAANGIKDGTEPGIDGVLLSLFIDANDDNIPDTPGVPLLTGVTAGGGNYSFTGLAPGNYIVRVDQDNFDAGGNTSLLTLQNSPITSPEPPDPDDGAPDIDNDDNGARAIGQPAFSKAITLAYNSEPSAGTGNDTNTTLDFGFFSNPPPDLTGLQGDTAAFTEGGPAVLLDDASAPEVAATVTDNQTHFNGGNLTASITGNEAAAEDVLGISTAGTVTLSNGTNAGSIVSVSGLAIGTIAAGGTGTGGNDLVVTFNTTDATPANVSTLIQALTYFNSNTLNLSTLQRTVAISVNDGLGGVDSENVLVNITDINDEPTLIATGNNPTFTEGGAAADLYSAVTASTVESGQTFTSLTLTVTNVTDGANEILQINGTDVALTDGATDVGVGTANVSVNNGTATVSLTSAALSESQLQTLIDGLTYRNSSENPTDAGRTVTITNLVDSGSNVSPNDNTALLSLASIVNVNPVNDAPVLSNVDANAAYIENGAAVALDTAPLIVPSDVDNLTLSAATVAITAGFVVGDTLDFPDLPIPASIGATYNAMTGVLTINAVDTLVDYQQVLRDITFSSTSDTPGTSRTITWTITDNASPTATSLAQTTTIAVTPVNDPPALDLDANDSAAAGSDYATLYIPRGPAVSITDSDDTILDPDHTTLASATITLTNHQANDLLSVNGALPGNITASVYNAGTGVLTLTSVGATATLAQWQTALHQIEFSNANTVPDTTARDITIVVNDGADNSNTAHATISLEIPPTQFEDAALELAAFAPGTDGWISDDLYKRELADVNGDGMDDIVGFASDGVYVSRATGNGHFAAPTFELAAFTPGTDGWISDDLYKRELADVNGDGMDDIVGFASDGVYVSRATGNGHFEASTFELAEFAPGAGGWISDDLYKRELADVNGDGLDDIVGFASDGVYLSLATGNGHFEASTFELAAFTPGTDGWISDDLYKRELADVNGDGLDDIVGFASDGVYVSESFFVI